MTKQSEENLELDGEQESSEGDVDTTSENELDSDDNTSDERKNQSNWKKMSQAKKELERELKAEREEKRELLKELQAVKEWANGLYENEDEKPFAKKEEKQAEDKTEKLELKIFLLDNKDAKEYIDDIQAVRKKY